MKAKNHQLCRIEYDEDKSIVTYRKPNPRMVEVFSAIDVIANKKGTGEKMWNTKYFQEINEKNHFVFCTGFTIGKDK